MSNVVLEMHPMGNPTVETRIALLRERMAIMQQGRAIMHQLLGDIQLKIAHCERSFRASAMPNFDAECACNSDDSGDRREGTLSDGVRREGTPQGFLKALGCQLVSLRHEANRLDQIVGGQQKLLDSLIREFRRRLRHQRTASGHARGSTRPLALGAFSRSDVSNAADIRCCPDLSRSPK